jgi:hypothetical protein
MNAKVNCKILISTYNVRRICKTRYAQAVEVTELRAFSAQTLQFIPRYGRSQLAVTPMVCSPF